MLSNVILKKNQRIGPISESYILLAEMHDNFCPISPLNKFLPQSWF